MWSSSGVGWTRIVRDSLGFARTTRGRAAFVRRARSDYHDTLCSLPVVSVTTGRGAIPRTKHIATKAWRLEDGWDIDGRARQSALSSQPSLNGPGQLGKAKEDWCIALRQLEGGGGGGGGNVQAKWHAQTGSAREFPSPFSRGRLHGRWTSAQSMPLAAVTTAQGIYRCALIASR